MRLETLELSRIVPGERFRTEYGEKEMEDLRVSIMREGLIQPIAVMEQPDGKFLLLAGGRRFQACSDIGEQTVPCRVYSGIPELEQRSIELHENITRKDMTWQEVVKLKEEIHDLKIAQHGDKMGSTAADADGWTKTRTANMFGESLQNFSRDLELAQVVGVIPELNKAKTKTEAQKILQKFKKHAENKYVVETLLARDRDTPMEKIQQKLCESFVVADVFTKLGALSDNSIHLIEIDPPYGIDLSKQRKVVTEGSTTLTYNEVPGSEYRAFLASLFSECQRVLTNDGWLICWFGPDPWYEVVRDELKAAGLKVAGIPGAWVKPQGQTMNPQMRLGNSYELFFYASKGNAQINKQGRANTFCYKLVPPDKKIHPTERPIELLEEILQTFAMPGANVLVPFAGSGNTLLAAANVNMKAFGYDLSPEYRDAYAVRVHCGKPGTYKSYA